MRPCFWSMRPRHAFSALCRPPACSRASDATRPRLTATMHLTTASASSVTHPLWMQDLLPKAEQLDRQDMIGDSAASAAAAAAAERAKQIAMQVLSSTDAVVQDGEGRTWKHAMVLLDVCRAWAEQLPSDVRSQLPGRKNKRTVFEGDPRFELHYSDKHCNYIVVLKPERVNSSPTSLGPAASTASSSSYPSSRDAANILKRCRRAWPKDAIKRFACRLLVGQTVSANGRTYHHSVTLNDLGMALLRPPDGSPRVSFDGKLKTHFIDQPGFLVTEATLAGRRDKVITLDVAWLLAQRAGTADPPAPPAPTPPTPSAGTADPPAPPEPTPPLTPSTPHPAPSTSSRFTPIDIHQACSRVWPDNDALRHAGHLLANNAVCGDERTYFNNALPLQTVLTMVAMPLSGMRCLDPSVLEASLFSDPHFQLAWADVENRRQQVLVLDVERLMASVAAPTPTPVPAAATASAAATPDRLAASSGGASVTGEGGEGATTAAEVAAAARAAPAAATAAVAATALASSRTEAAAAAAAAAATPSPAPSWALPASARRSLFGAAPEASAESPRQAAGQRQLPASSSSSSSVSSSDNDSCGGGGGFARMFTLEFTPPGHEPWYSPLPSDEQRADSQGRLGGEQERQHPALSEEAAANITSILQAMPPRLRDALAPCIQGALPAGCSFPGCSFPGTGARGQEAGGERALPSGPLSLMEVALDEGRDWVLLRFRELDRPLLMKGLQVSMEEATLSLQARPGAARGPALGTAVTTHSGEAPGAAAIASPQKLFTSDGRVGIAGTLHRISGARDADGRVYALTYRVGHHLPGVADIFRDVLATMCATHWPLSMAAAAAAGTGRRGRAVRSVLLVWPPGVGKTTLLRDVTRLLADDFGRSVAVIDTSNEIAGDAEAPHPCIGSARRFRPHTRDMQHRLMVEVVQNHTPQVVVVDEIGTEQEVLAARSIAQRGVAMVGTAHSNGLESLLSNPELVPLVGGLRTVTVGDKLALSSSGGVKSRKERADTPVFSTLVEVLATNRWRIHWDVAESVDLLLASERGQQALDARDGGCTSGTDEWGDEDTEEEEEKAIGRGGGSGSATGSRSPALAVVRPHTEVRSYSNGPVGDARQMVVEFETATAARRALAAAQAMGRRAADPER